MFDELETSEQLFVNISGFVSEQIYGVAYICDVWKTFCCLQILLSFILAILSSNIISCVMKEKWKGVLVDNLSQLDAISSSFYHTCPSQNSLKIYSESSLGEI